MPITVASISASTENPPYFTSLVIVVNYGPFHRSLANPADSTLGSENPLVILSANAIGATKVAFIQWSATPLQKVLPALGTQVTLHSPCYVFQHWL